MKKSRIIFLILVLTIAAGTIWLLRGADPQTLDRQDVIIDVVDEFEK